MQPVLFVYKEIDQDFLLPIPPSTILDFYDLTSIPCPIHLTTPYIDHALSYHALCVAVPISTGSALWNLRQSALPQLLNLACFHQSTCRRLPTDKKLSPKVCEKLQLGWYCADFIVLYGKEVKHSPIFNDIH